ncbi:unnamed protein product, partial [Prorocentrum cordatum]
VLSPQNRLLGPSCDALGALLGALRAANGREGSKQLKHLAGRRGAALARHRPAAPRVGPPPAAGLRRPPRVSAAQEGALRDRRGLTGPPLLGGGPWRVGRQGAEGPEGQGGGAKVRPLVAAGPARGVRRPARALERPLQFFRRRDVPGLAAALGPGSAQAGCRCCVAGGSRASWPAAAPAGAVGPLAARGLRGGPGPGERLGRPGRVDAPRASRPSALIPLPGPGAAHAAGSSHESCAPRPDEASGLRGGARHGGRVREAEPARIPRHALHSEGDQPDQRAVLPDGGGARVRREHAADVRPDLDYRSTARRRPEWVKKASPALGGSVGRERRGAGGYASAPDRPSTNALGNSGPSVALSSPPPLTFPPASRPEGTTVCWPTSAGAGAFPSGWAAQGALRRSARGAAQPVARARRRARAGSLLRRPLPRLVYLISSLPSSSLPPSLPPSLRPSSSLPP